MGKQIHFNAFAMGCAGHQSPGLWRHPDDRSSEYTDLEYWSDLARLLERGCFDSLFLADVLGQYDVYGGSAAAAIRAGVQIPNLDPTCAIAAMAAVTQHLGFGVTVSLTYEQPYSFARRMTTLDHLTKGRVSWNIVTSYLDSAARNLGLAQQLDHDERYELGEEFLEVCYRLWESSWEDDAVVMDANRGVFADPAKVHPIRHRGRHYQVPDAFLAAPSPQRTPVLFQAGASKRGRRFAATHAEAVFVNASSPGQLRRLVETLRAEAESVGRDPESVKIFAIMTAVAGHTDEEARAKLASYRSYADPEGALALFGGWTGIDASAYARDEPLRRIETQSMRSVVELMTDGSRDREWTWAEIAEDLGVGGRGPVIVGSGQTVADQLEGWADESGVDGFNFAYAVSPGTFEDLVEHVVPELQSRGRMRTSYPGSTLRESLYGSGQKRLRHDHPAFRYTWAAASREPEVQTA